MTVALAGFFAALATHGLHQHLERHYWRDTALTLVGTWGFGFVLLYAMFWPQV